MRNIQLFQKLEAMKIEPESARLTFPARLARENGWTQEFAERVVGEYKRFLYLAATSGRSVTPSDEVDQAWHLHLSYTRHYWGVLCAEILQKPLHHGPTEGGTAEDERYRAQYEETLASYSAAFGSAPPADIWPPSDKRFGTIYRRVVEGLHWMVPKKAVYAVAPMLALAACTKEQFETVGGPFLIIGLVVLLLSDILRPGKRRRKNRDRGCSGASGCSSSYDDSGSSGCGGGCGGD